MRKRWIVFVSLVAVLGSGCASTSQHLLEHPKAVVRYPAKAGEVAGVIVGIPVGIVLLPVSWTIGATSGDPETEAWAPLYPAVGTKDLVTVVVAGPSWLIFGWWGETEPVHQPETLHTSSELPSSTGQAKDASTGLSDAQFARALRNVSTAPNYILMTVVNGNTKTRESVCLEAQALLSALYLEHGLRRDEAVEFVLARPHGTFTFTHSDALALVARPYSGQSLNAARDFLATMTLDEIEAATCDPQSQFYAYCTRESGVGNSRFFAVAHVLAEQGVLCSRGCKPGVFHLDRRSGDITK